MKHADSDTLAHLAPLLDQVRQRMPPLKEKGTGRFYLKSAAFLHFHHDPTGLFADLKVNGDWQRYPVNYREFTLKQPVSSLVNWGMITIRQ